MGGLKGNIVLYIALIIVSVTVVWTERSYKITETLDPVLSLYLGLALAFVAGCIVGAAGLSIWQALCPSSRDDREARHAR